MQVANLAIFVNESTTIGQNSSLKAWHDLARVCTSRCFFCNTFLLPLPLTEVSSDPKQKQMKQENFNQRCPSSLPLIPIFD